MEGVVVSGRFVDQHRNPVEGHIQFIPSRLWVLHENEAYATMAPEMDLDEDGAFEVTLTPTHGHEGYQWHYTVICPVGKWSIHIEESDQPVSIRKLLPARFH